MKNMETAGGSSTVSIDDFRSKLQRLSHDFNQAQQVESSAQANNHAARLQVVRVMNDLNTNSDMTEEEQAQMLNVVDHEARTGDLLEANREFVKSQQSLQDATALVAYFKGEQDVYRQILDRLEHPDHHETQHGLKTAKLDDLRKRLTKAS
jgi:hypothetical protein